MELYRSQVLVCGGTGCSSSGSAKLIERFEEQLKEKGLDKEVKIVRTGCFGLCEAGPGHHLSGRHLLQPCEAGRRG